MIGYDWLHFGIYAIAVWRLAFMLVYDYGPWGVFLRLRSRFGVIHDDAGEHVSVPVGSVLGCVGCMAIWVAAILWILPFEVITIIAAAGIAKLVQGWYER